MKRPFWKLSGAGNDFILVTARSIQGLSRPRLARRLCRRRASVGADGLLVLAPAARGPSRLEYYNPDGSKAFCGNGARCALAWLHAERPGLKTLALRVGKALVEGTLASWDARTSRGRLEVAMPTARLLRKGLRLRVCGRVFDILLFDTGVPHAVALVRGLEGFDLVRCGRALRRHPALGPSGANADFIRIAGGLVSLRTYERGVEDETPACGTGATAAALAAHLWAGLESPARILTRGGAVLRVSFSREAAGWKVSLEGPAEIVFRGEVDL
jgi:diaminopimelate epimerase